MRKILLLLFSIVAILPFTGVVIAQDDAADGATLESVTADSPAFYGQEVTLEGAVIEFLNARIFVLGEGAALDDDKVLVINNTSQELDPRIISGERARLTGVVMPSFEEGGFGQLISNGMHMDGVDDHAMSQEPSAGGETTNTTQASAAPGEPIQVNLSEYVIDMPTSLPAGTVTFQVTNNGTEEHGFEIEGNGVEYALLANLQPGESQTLEAQLQPGTYEVYCPVEGHAGQGMHFQLQVTEAEAMTEADQAAQPTVDPNAQPTTAPDTAVEPAEVDPATDRVMPEIDFAILESVIAERYPEYTILELTSMQGVEALLEPAQ